MKKIAEGTGPAPHAELSGPAARQDKERRTFSAGETPDWLAQPKSVADAAASAPALDLARPSPNALTIGGRSVSTPFAARDLSGPAGRAFAGQPTPKAKLWTERADASGKSVNKLVLTHTVCNSVAHSLHLFARNGLSVHGIIDVDGTLHQLVDLREKAFVAGAFNESVIGFGFQSPVDARVDQRSAGGGERIQTVIEECMPRKGSDLYTHWRISDAQKSAAAQLAHWLSEQPTFSIMPKVADPAWLPDADEARQFSGALGLYQLRDIHIAPGFDAMAGVAAHMNTRKDLAS